MGRITANAVINLFLLISFIITVFPNERLNFSEASLVIISLFSSIFRSLVLVFSEFEEVLFLLVFDVPKFLSLSS